MGLKALGDPVPDRAFLGVAFRWMATGNWLFAWPWRGLGPVLLTVLPYLKYLWTRIMRHRTAPPSPAAKSGQSLFDLDTI
mgnify:CR=1 FL=1